MAGGSRRDRSRSPTRGDSSRRRERDSLHGSSHSISTPRREPLIQDNPPPLPAPPGLNLMNTMTNMNPMMMQNMYPQSMQGNMMMGGMYNMMMGQNGMMAPPMMPTNNMDMMTTNNMDMMSSSGMANMDIVPQQSMDMANMGTQSLSNVQNPPMEMNMMGGMMTNMGNTALMGMYPNMGAENIAPAQEKKEIIFKYCTLIPPPPGTPQPPCRPKPPGCRTIFVGGLPDKTRESIVRDVFESFGRIQTLRLSKKNFCHIRFDREECVDAAMTITGYNMKLIPKDDKDKDAEENPRAYTGWLHVDYAMSRDDQNDFERKQRDAARLQQQQIDQMSMHQMSYRRSPSPMRMVPFSSAAVTQLAEKIKTEDMFHSSLPTLITWLERGECSKKNANQFYSMIQATNSHIRRLFNEKMQAEEELQDFKEKIKARIEKVIDQLEQVGKVFAAATHQRVWDHFTKPQRKNIETWQRMTQEFNTLREEFQEKFDNEDSDYNGANNRALESSSSQDELMQLKRENESLQFQLEAYKNEVDVIKMDTQKEMEKFKAQFIARQALQNHNMPPLPAPQSRPPPPPEEPRHTAPVHTTPVHIAPVHTAQSVSASDAQLIAVMATFLHVHPQGASIDYIVSYVRAMFPQYSQSTIHHVMQKHADTFQKKTSGVGANIDSKWFLVAFNTTPDTKMEA